MTGLNDNLDDVVNMRKVARTCSIPQVAEAAVISIGGELARLTSLKAAWSGMSRGAYVADMVLAFQRAGLGAGRAGDTGDGPADSRRAASSPGEALRKRGRLPGDDACRRSIVDKRKNLFDAAEATLRR